jgi:calcineurin-like phosphoesterase family protein
MDEVIINNYKSVVRPGDMVFFLGDFCFKCDPMIYIKRINTKQIHMIWGNHDLKIKKYACHFASESNLRDIKIDGFPLTLCHYAMRVWNKSHFNSGMLYGHSHNRLQSQGKSLDCGVDGHNFFPWSWEEVKQKMSELPDNFNLVKESNRYTNNKQNGDSNE